PVAREPRGRREDRVDPWTVSRSCNFVKKADQIASAAVIGAGTMGHGIAQMLALCGVRTVLVDLDQTALAKGLAAIGKNLDAGVEKQKVRPDEREAALARVSGSRDL